MQLTKAQFKRSLHRLFREIERRPDKRYFEADLLPFVRLSDPEHKGRTNTEIALDKLYSRDHYGEKKYGGHYAQTDFFRANLEVFPRLIVPQAAYVSLNCGPIIFVIERDEKIFDSINAHGYVAVDTSESYSQTAAYVYRGMEPVKKATALPIDFTRPFNLRDVEIDGEKIGSRPVFCTIFGDDIANVQNLTNALKNLSRATQDQAVVLLVTNGYRFKIDPMPLYRGSDVCNLSKSLWWAAANVLSEHSSTSRAGKLNTFDPNVFEPIQRIDSGLSIVKQEAVVFEDTYAPLGHRTVKIPQGTIIRTGSWHVRDVNDIAEAAKKAKWEIVPITFTVSQESDHPPAEAICIMAKSTPRSWVPALGYSTAPR